VDSEDGYKITPGFRTPLLHECASLLVAMVHLGEKCSHSAAVPQPSTRMNVHGGGRSVVICAAGASCSLDAPSPAPCVLLMLLCGVGAAPCVLCKYVL
jgi:hypothetical protein